LRHFTQLKRQAARPCVQHTMKVSLLILVTIGTLCLCLFAAAEDKAPLAVLDALPPPDALGVGWEREIAVLFDPASSPSELFAASSRLPESFKQDRRDRVRNPTNQISGWCHLHFTLQTSNATRRYDVQMQRYRNKDRLRADFSKLELADVAEYHKVPVDGLGDAGLFCRSKNGGSTVWFRRADFMVWIAPMGLVTNWEQDSQLKYLSRKIDQRIAGRKARAIEPSVSGNGEEKP